jgi:RHS repeat-associated protein
VDIVNSMSSPFGAGWSLNVLQRIWPVTGGVILEEPGGLSLWFANGSPAGTFVTPPGDTSTLTQNTTTNVYTRTLKDGTQINFNSSGYQTSIVDRIGNTLLTFGYNGSNQLTTVTDLNGLVTTISYNASGKATTFLDPASRTTTLGYDASNTNLTSITDADSALWQYGYDSADRMTSLTDPRTYTTTFAYNSTAERIATVTRADSTTELLTAEQMNGIPASGTGTQSSPATPVLAAQAQASFTDPRNNVWNTNLDWLGFGEATQASDPLGDMGINYVDANGFPWLNSDPLGRRTRNFFDTKENPTEIVLPDDRHMQYTYNSFSEPTNFTDPRNATTTYSYDTNGNVTLVTDPLNNQTKYTYTTVNNTKGLRSTMVDPLSRTTSYGYDTRGRLQTVTDPTTALTTYGYDTASDLTTLTNPLGFTTTNSYDAMGRLLTVKQPDSNPNNHPTITYTYDAAGNETSITDPVGNTTTTAYDHMNRSTTITDALNHNTILAYDSAGNLGSKTDRNGRQTTYSYDAAGRLTGKTWVSGNYVATYAYDAASELTSETDGNSNYSLSYDTAGRLITVDNANTPNAPHVLLTYTYDAADNRTGLTDNLNGSVSYTYDADHRLTNVSMTVNGTAGPQVTMTPDPYGRLSQIVRQSPGGKQIVTNYSYDADNRITYIQQGYYTIGTIVNQLAQYTYVYDNAGEETGYTGPEGSITLAYDQRGELTSVTGAWSESYSYDLNGNRNMTGWTTSTGNRLTSDGTYNYTYDNEGNMLTKTRISDGQITNFTWDYRNRLAEVTVKTSTGTTLQDDKFTYDVQNQRIGKSTLSGSQSWTAYNGVNPYADFNSGGSLTYRFLYGDTPDFLLARYDGTNTIWYLDDKLGSVRLLVDKSANIQDTITYDSFGNIRTETGTGDRFKFTGREWDSEISQYYFRARYYTPSIGRFDSEDPLKFAAQDPNLYRYIGNNPLMSTDPSGTVYSWGFAAGGAILGGIGGFAGGVGYQSVMALTGHGFDWGGVGVSTMAGVVTGAVAGAATGLIVGGDPSALLIGGSFLTTAGVTAGSSFLGGAYAGALSASRKPKPPPVLGPGALPGVALPPMNMVQFQAYIFYRDWMGLF